MNIIYLLFLLVSFISFKIAKTFVVDSYSGEYHYFQADKNNKYISASMNVTSSSSNPKLPMCAIYYVDGDKLEYGHHTFMTRFARWDDFKLDLMGICVSFFGNI